MQAHVEAMHQNLMRDMRVADRSRRINPEAARAAVRPLAGVQSTAWIDRDNLLVVVGCGVHCSMATIDRVCRVEGALLVAADHVPMARSRVHLRDILQLRNSIV